MEINLVRPTRLSAPPILDRDFVGETRNPSAATTETVTAVPPVPTSSSSSATDDKRAFGDTRGLRLSVDPDARQVVYQTVDSFTGEVVAQTPDRALLRQRAYVIQMQEARAAVVASERDSGVVERNV